MTTGRKAPDAPALDLSLLRAPLQLKEETYDSPVFGPLRLRELTRREYRSLAKLSRSPDDPTESDADLWNANMFLIGVTRADTGEPLFASADQMLDLPYSARVWDEILEIDKKIIALSEVGKEALKSEDPPADAG